MISKYIVSIGIELECGACEEKLIALKNKYNNGRFELGGDLSVLVKPRKEKAYCLNWIPNAEIRYWSPDLNDLIRFIIDAFSIAKIKQNNTCGNHIHLRLKKPYHILVVSYDFIEEFRSEYVDYIMKLAYRKRKKYLARMDSSFCRFPLDLFDYSENLYARNRFYAINYCSFLEKQQTLEIRIMPYVSSAKEYLSNLMWIIKTVEKIIDKLISAKIDKIEFETETEIPDIDIANINNWIEIEDEIA